MNPKKMSASEVLYKIRENRPFDLLDLRSVAEFMSGFIPFAINLPESESDFIVNISKIWFSPEIPLTEEDLRKRLWLVP